MSVLVSVIVPVHDGERFVGEALGAISAQTYENVEIIVVDDGSTDDSARIAEELVGAHGRGVVHRQPQGGVAAARNAGLAWRPASCSRSATRTTCGSRRSSSVRWPTSTHPNIGAVMTRQEPFFEDDIVERPAWLKRDKVYGDLGGMLQLSALIRREAFEVVGGFAESRPGADDLDWFLRARRRESGSTSSPRSSCAGACTPTTPATTPRSCAGR